MKLQYSVTSSSFIQQGSRLKQEDALYFHSFAPNSHFYIVCDGVGGSTCGSQASEAVCRLMPEIFGPHIINGKRLSDIDLAKLIVCVQKQMAKDITGSSATTMAMLYLHRNGATAVHIGDSRIYQFRKGLGKIFCTKDHSLVQEFIDEGVITEEQARTHPNRNIITQAIHPLNEGDERPVPAIDHIDDIHEGDIFILCTDGVWNMFTDDELSQLLYAENLSLEQRVQAIAEITTDSSDNNTAIVVAVDKIEGKRHNSWFKTLTQRYIK